MHLLLFLVFGLAVGAVARLLFPGREAGGWLTSLGLGIAGAIFGGFLGQLIGLYRPDQGAGFVMSVVGAMLLIAVYRAFTRPHAFR